MADSQRLRGILVPETFVPSSSASFLAMVALRTVAGAFFLAALLSVSGCRAPGAVSELKRFEFSSAHMGTLFHITLYAPDKLTAEQAAEAAFWRINELETIMSDYQADSELNSLREQPVGVPRKISADLFDVLEKSQEYSSLSGGAFDVTMGPYVRLWRFARKRKELPSAAELASTAEAVGWRKIELNRRDHTITFRSPGMRLDVGGIAKGYAADSALAVLKSRGINRALVAASGDIAAGDSPPGRKGWAVAVSGLGTPQFTRTLSLKNAAVSTSGDTEQFIEIEGVRYSHILNPKTGLGLTNRIQATIIAKNATTTDALATTTCVLGPSRGVALLDSLPGVSGLVITLEGEQTKRLLSRRFARGIIEE